MIDCDLSIPTIPCPTPYDGSIYNALSYLNKERPRGWREESLKLRDLSSSGYGSTKLNQNFWPVRLRRISPGLVIPQQVNDAVTVNVLC